MHRLVAYEIGEGEWRTCLFWSPRYQASWVLMMTSQLLNKLIQFGSQPALTIKLNIWRGRGYECGPLHFSGTIIYALDKGYWIQRFGYMNTQPQIQTRFCMKFRGKKRLMWQVFLILPKDNTTFKVVRLLYWSHYTVCIIMGSWSSCGLHITQVIGCHTFQDISREGSLSGLHTMLH